MALYFELKRTLLESDSFTSFTLKFSKYLFPKRQTHTIHNGPYSLKRNNFIPGISLTMRPDLFF